MALVQLLEDCLNGRRDTQFFEDLLSAAHDEIQHIYHSSLSENDKINYINQILQIMCDMLSTPQSSMLIEIKKLSDYLKNLK